MQPAIAITSHTAIKLLCCVHTKCEQSRSSLFITRRNTSLLSLLLSSLFCMNSYILCVFVHSFLITHKHKRLQYIKLIISLQSDTGCLCIFSHQILVVNNQALKGHRNTQLRLSCQNQCDFNCLTFIM